MDVHFRALKANRFVGHDVGPDPKTQHVAPGFDRLCHQRDRLLAKKLKSNDPDFPLKPKGMRRSTNERHLDKLEYLHKLRRDPFISAGGDYWRDARKLSRKRRAH